MFKFRVGVQGLAGTGHNLEILCCKQGGTVDSAYTLKEFEVDIHGVRALAFGASWGHLTTEFQA